MQPLPDIIECAICGKYANIHIRLDDEYEYVVCDEHISNARDYAKKYASSKKAYFPGLIAGEYAIGIFMKQEFTIGSVKNVRANNSSLVMYDGEWTIRLYTHIDAINITFELLAEHNPDLATIIFAAKRKCIEYCTI